MHHGNARLALAELGVPSTVEPLLYAVYDPTWPPELRIGLAASARPSPATPW